MQPDAVWSATTGGSTNTVAARTLADTAARAVARPYLAATGVSCSRHKSSPALVPRSSLASDGPRHPEEELALDSAHVRLIAVTARPKERALPVGSCRAWASEVPPTHCSQALADSSQLDASNASECPLAAARPRGHTQRSRLHAHQDHLLLGVLTEGHRSAVKRASVCRHASRRTTGTPACQECLLPKMHRRDLPSQCRPSERQGHLRGGRLNIEAQRRYEQSFKG